MKALRVYSGNYDGRNRRMVAARSKAEAMRLMNVPRSSFNNYFSDCTESASAAIALAKPSVVFEQSMSIHNPDWRIVK